jgi:hypothetical protein
MNTVEDAFADYKIASPRRSTDRPERHADDSIQTYDISLPLLEGLSNFFERPWFRRLWVLQEVRLPGHGFCVPGPLRMRWLGMMRNRMLYISTEAP